MKTKYAWTGWGFLVPALVLIPSLAFASEGSGGGRALWDQIWMYINSAILLGLIYKYGRQPLMKFLRGQGDAVAERIQEVEDQKAKAAEELARIKDTLARQDEHLDTIMGLAMEEAEAVKKTLIEEAENEARVLLQNAERQITGKMRQAAGQFREALLEEAIRIAEGKLREAMNPEDQKRLQDQYLQFIDQAA